MFEITNGSQTLIVSRGAYFNQYAPMGWRPVVKAFGAEKDKVVEMVQAPVVEDVNAVVVIDDSISENEGCVSGCAADGVDENEAVEDDKEGATEAVGIPLTEMSNKQLRDEAKRLGVDLTGFNKKAEVIQAIRAAQEE